MVFHIPVAQLFICSITVVAGGEARSFTTLPSARNTTRSRMRHVRVISDHDDRLSKIIDRAAQEFQHLDRGVRVEVALWAHRRRSALGRGGAVPGLQAGGAAVAPP